MVGLRNSKELLIILSDASELSDKSNVDLGCYNEQHVESARFFFVFFATVDRSHNYYCRLECG